MIPVAVSRHPVPGGAGSSTAPTVPVPRSGQTLAADPPSGGDRCGSGPSAHGPDLHPHKIPAVPLSGLPGRFAACATSSQPAGHLLAVNPLAANARPVERELSPALPLPVGAA